MKQQKKRQCKQNNPAIVDIVQYSQKLRLTEKETVAKLSQLGFDVDVRTIRRIKQKLPRPTRLDKLAEEEVFSFIKDTISDLKQTINEVKKVAADAKNPFLKLQALGMIPKLRKDIADFYDASPIVASLSNRLNENVMEEH